MYGDVKYTNQDVFFYIFINVTVETKWSVCVHEILFFYSVFKNSGPKVQVELKKLVVFFVA